MIQYKFGFFGLEILRVLFITETKFLLLLKGGLKSFENGATTKRNVKREDYI